MRKEEGPHHTLEEGQEEGDEDSEQDIKKLNQVTLNISCMGLKDMDLTSKSDPYCIVFEEVPEQDENSEDRWREVGRTDTKQDDLNPAFDKTIEMNYYFEKS